jgi:hypothetical protein
MPKRSRLLTLDLDSEPLWVRLYVQPHGDHWATMIVGDDVLPPEPGTLTGLTFFGAIHDEVERGGKATLERYT